jgi:hypothetical protein
VEGSAREIPWPEKMEQVVGTSAGTNPQRRPGAVSGCSGVWVPPAKYRNNEASDQGDYLDAHYDPVPDRRGIPMSNPDRRVQKRVQKPVYRIRTEGRDFSLGKTLPQFAVAIDAQIDRDDASDDFIKKKLHSNSRSSSTDPMTRPYDPSIDRVPSALPGLVRSDLVLVQLQERSR